MKFSIIACIVFFIGFKSFADCGGGGLTAFPHSGKIRKNCVFVVDGYASSQKVIQGLTKKFPVYLKSGSEQIPLKVLEICVGDFYMTQAILKPEKPLTSGKEYQLIIENLPGHNQLSVYNPKTHKSDPISYFVTDASDTDAPVWTQKPKEKDKSLVHFGCGPSIHVNFKLNVKEESDFLIRTTVKNVKTGSETTYYIGSEDNVLSIGHGMCSGAFDFDDSVNYEAKFAVMDFSGNVSGETEWVAFTKPVD